MHLGPLTDLYGTPGAPKRARFGPEWPFWGPRRSSDGPGGPDLVPTAPNWSAWAGLMLTTHFDLVSGPFWAPGGPKRARFGPKCPFWGPRRSSEGPGGPDLVPTAPDWPAWVGHMVTTHFDLVSGLSWAPGGPKRAPFGPKCPLALNFHGPILCGNFFSKYRLVGCPEHRSGMLCSSSTVIVHIEPPSLRKRPKRGKKGPFWPEKVLSGTSEVLGGPRGTRFGPNCPPLACLGWTHGHHSL